MMASKLPILKHVSINELSRSLLYSEELGIDLPSNKDGELFKWFLASILMGTHLSETIAKNTYLIFKKYYLLRPEDILLAGWDFLVNPVMRQGGFVRYDEKTSSQILRNCQTLLKKYQGSLTSLHDQASDSRDLENRIQDFYGIGPITTNIFLRELRPHWKKSNPELLPMVKKVAIRYHLDLEDLNRKSEKFIRVETGLIRLRKKVNKNIEFSEVYY